MSEKEMTEIKYIDDSKRDIDLNNLIARVLREWRLLLKWAAVAFIAGVVVSFSIPKTFMVVTKMAPESSENSSTSALSSLAGMAGLNLGSVLSSSDAVSPDIYPDIITSTPFVVEMLRTPLEFERKGKTVRTDYYTYVQDYVRTPWWNAVLDAPKMLMTAVVGLFKPGEKEDSSGGIESLDPSHLTYDQAAIVGHFKKYVVIAIDKKTGIIILSVKEQIPEVSEQVSTAVVEGIQRYVTNYRTEKARQDLEYYQRLSDEAKEEYSQAQQRYAEYLDRNQSIIMQRGRAEQDRLKNEVSLAYTLYNSCAQQVQTSKARVQQQTPAFTIIDPPVFPLWGKPKRSLVVLVCLFLGFFCAVVWILWGRSAVASIKNNDERPVTEVGEEDKA